MNTVIVKKKKSLIICISMEICYDLKLCVKYSKQYYSNQL